MPCCASSLLGWGLQEKKPAEGRVAEDTNISLRAEKNGLGLMVQHETTTDRNG